jgi:ribosomal protein S18 acetylase RimI-like enzyme/diadenosine tetraphosphate (Ap4A) HIT family hydrolase
VSAWRDPGRWGRLRSPAGCPICTAPPPRDTVVVAKLAAARVHATPAVPVRGYCCVVCDRHVAELHELDEPAAEAFLRDVRRVSRELAVVTGCVKLNTEIHGNTIPHLHVHLYPRFAGDPFEDGPIDLRRTLPSPWGPGEHEAFVAALRARLSATPAAEPSAGPPWSIRSFVPADTEAVLALWERAGLLRPWNDPRKDIARKLRVQPELFLVAVAGHALVAAAMVGYDGHRGWMNYLAVDAAARGRGFGRALVADAERRLRALGCPKLNVQVRGDNVAALGFYERLGFVRDDAVSLGKRLERDDPEA